MLTEWILDAAMGITLLGLLAWVVDQSTPASRLIPLKIGLWSLVLLRGLWPPMLQLHVPVFPPSITAHSNIGIWAIGVWVAGMVVVMGWMLMPHLRSRPSLRMPNALLLQRYQQCGRRLGLRRLPPLRCATGTASAYLRGVFRPQVIVPEGLPESVQNAALCHELAHFKRRDHWRMAVAQCLTVLFWWHPLIWLAQRRYQQFNEFSCDQLAAGVMGLQQYRKGLAAAGLFAQRNHQDSRHSKHAAAALAMVRGGRLLLARLAHVIRPQRAGLRYIQTATALALLVMSALQTSGQWSQLPGWGDKPGCLLQRYTVMAQLYQQQRAAE